MLTDRDPLVYLIDPDASLTGTAELLRENSVEFCSFASAEEFLAGFDASRVSCLVTDAHLPGMDPLRLIEYLRKQGHFVPTILMAQCSEVQTAVAAVKAGAIDCVEKPVRTRGLVDKIRGILHLEPDTLHPASP